MAKDNTAWRNAGVMNFMRGNIKASIKHVQTVHDSSLVSERAKDLAIIAEESLQDLAEELGKK